MQKVTRPLETIYDHADSSTLLLDPYCVVWEEVKKVYKVFTSGPKISECAGIGQIIKCVYQGGGHYHWKVVRGCAAVMTHFFRPVGAP